jgi:hypothetical protein
MALFLFPSRCYVWLSIENRTLGVSEFFVAAVIAAGVDEFLGSGEIILRGFPRVSSLAKEEASAIEVDIDHMQTHRAAFGNVSDFVEVTARARTIIDQPPKPRSCNQSSGHTILIT